MELMTIGEDWNGDGLVNQELRLMAQLPLHLDGSVQRPHYCWRCTRPSVHISPHFPHHLWTREIRSLSLGEATVPQPGGNNPLVSGREWWPRTCLIFELSFCCKIYQSYRVTNMAGFLQLSGRCPFPFNRDFRCSLMRILQNMYKESITNESHSTPFLISPQCLYILNEQAYNIKFSCCSQILITSHRHKSGISL